jgi:hypothetical protein
MLLIRGDTRVADIYLTEFDRLFLVWMKKMWPCLRNSSSFRNQSSRLVAGNAFLPSASSLTGNDENMLLIRGDTRVADIYLTEFDRLFRHFYAASGAPRSASRSIVWRA